MHAWREEVFRLLGDCVGASKEVDQRTISKEIVTHGKERVLLGNFLFKFLSGWEIPRSRSL